MTPSIDLSEKEQLELISKPIDYASKSLFVEIARNSEHKSVHKNLLGRGLVNNLCQNPYLSYDTIQEVIPSFGYNKGRLQTFQTSAYLREFVLYSPNQLIIEELSFSKNVEVLEHLLKNPNIQAPITERVNLRLSVHNLNKSFNSNNRIDILQIESNSKIDYIDILNLVSIPNNTPVSHFHFKDSKTLGDLKSSIVRTSCEEKLQEEAFKKGYRSDLLNNKNLHPSVAKHIIAYFYTYKDSDQKSLLLNSQNPETVKLLFDNAIRNKSHVHILASNKNITKEMAKKLLSFNDMYTTEALENNPTVKNYGLFVTKKKEIPHFNYFSDLRFLIEAKDPEDTELILYGYKNYISVKDVEHTPIEGKKNYILLNLKNFRKLIARESPATDEQKSLAKLDNEEITNELFKNKMLSLDLLKSLRGKIKDENLKDLYSNISYHEALDYLLSEFKENQAVCVAKREHLYEKTVKQLLDFNLDSINYELFKNPYIISKPNLLDMVKDRINSGELVVFSDGIYNSCYEKLYNRSSVPEDIQLKIIEKNDSSQILVLALYTNLSQSVQNILMRDLSLNRRTRLALNEYISEETMIYLADDVSEKVTDALSTNKNLTKKAKDILEKRMADLSDRTFHTLEEEIAAKENSKTIQENVETQVNKIIEEPINLTHSFKDNLIIETNDAKIRIIGKQSVKLILAPFNDKYTKSNAAKAIAGLIAHAVLENVTSNNQFVEQIKSKVSHELKIEGMTLIGNELVDIVKEQLKSILNGKKDVDIQTLPEVTTSLLPDGIKISSQITQTNIVNSKETVK